MKLSMKALAVSALAGFAATAAHATFVANTGDLILGIQATSGTGAGTYIQIDLGSISNFVNQTGSVSLGNIGSFLSSTYGSGWNTNANLSYGLIATSPNSGTLGAGYTQYESWVSKAASSTGTSYGDYTSLGTSTGVTGTARALVAHASSYLYNSSNAMNSQYGFAAIGTGTGIGYGSPTGNVIIWQNSASNQVTWNDMTSGSTANGGDIFGGVGAGAAARLPMIQFGATDGNSNPLAFDQTLNAANNYADLRQITNGSATSQLLGTMNIDGSGNITYTSVTAVPEPSTYGLLGAGALAGVAAIRRRRKAAKLA